MDLSAWAFEKLADTKWGVIGLSWRDVACSHKPTKAAVNPFRSRTAMPSGYQPRPGWNRWMDKRMAGGFNSGSGSGGRRVN